MSSSICNKVQVELNAILKAKEEFQKTYNLATVSKNKDDIKTAREQKSILEEKIKALEKEIPRIELENFADTFAGALTKTGKK